MDDILIMNWLRNQGISEEEFVKVIERYMSVDSHKSKSEPMKRDDTGLEYPFSDKDFSSYGNPIVRRDHMPVETNQNSMIKHFKNMNADDKKAFMEMMMSEESDGHFCESKAKYLVANMFHNEDGRKYVGEKFDVMKAKEICERYRGMLPNSVGHFDVYVAINVHYHDLCELYKSWFGDNSDLKIIESAIIYWFNDHDYTGGCKIWENFNK